MDVNNYPKVWVHLMISGLLQIEVGQPNSHHSKFPCCRTMKWMKLACLCILLPLASQKQHEDAHTTDAVDQILHHIKQDQSTANPVGNQSSVEAGTKNDTLL